MRPLDPSESLEGRINYTIFIPYHIYNDLNLSTVEIIVFGCIHTLQDDAWPNPTNKQISDEINRSEKDVESAINSLEKHNLIKCRYNKIDGEREILALPPARWSTVEESLEDGWCTSEKEAIEKCCED